METPTVFKILLHISPSHSSIHAIQSPVSNPPNISDCSGTRALVILQTVRQERSRVILAVLVIFIIACFGCCRFGNIPLLTVAAVRRGSPTSVTAETLWSAFVFVYVANGFCLCRTNGTSASRPSGCGGLYGTFFLRFVVVVIIIIEETTVVQHRRGCHGGWEERLMWDTVELWCVCASLDFWIIIKFWKKNDVVGLCDDEGLA
mmetsp:Transcript_819/g.1686  ORF Transcript_819/g.1686 Transcript_819/m.1686 type:complete len:204 (-) Transcript_819:60-671(-)